MKLLSRVRLLTTPWTAAYQAPPSLGFSRQEYWSGVPLSSPQDENQILFIPKSGNEMHTSTIKKGFSGSSAVKNPPAMQENLVQPLAWEDPLKKG